MSRVADLQHILLVFVDGLGIGRHDPESNPCCRPGLRLLHQCEETPFPHPLAPAGLALGLDANLGVAGLPQSATGQTALLTGINGARLLGRHLNAFPNKALREVIAVHNILKRFTDAGFRAAFLNTFRPPFFDLDPFAIISHLSVTSVSNLYAGLKFFDLDDLRAGRSVNQDITGASLRDHGFDVPLYSPQEAGEIIGRASQHYDFSLFEYFQTDVAGHSRDFSRALPVLIRLEDFLASILATVDLTTTLVLVTSDHGNIEDLAVKGHTRNPAMTLLFGCGCSEIAAQLHTLTDVTPVLLAARAGA
ncbi:MAG TPA: peptidase [bacterium]|nr:peptidase [bacterium]HPR88020.1 peptidase [bacterium]